LEKIACTMGEETVVSASLGKCANRKGEVLVRQKTGDNARYGQEMVLSGI
jgi:hypothetical protein